MESKSPHNRGTQETESIKVAGPEFPVVGVGASAGGLEAFASFFRQMPKDTGMAFILIQHIEPSHVSNMVELIQKYTRMPVIEVKDQVKVEPNHVYMIPQDRATSISDRILKLSEPTGNLTGHSIDPFFRSLAQDLKDQAICVILSGTASDGTIGARAVKAEAGLVLVQDPQDARYDGMPRSAIEAGLADFILPADKMAAKLMEYIGDSYGKPAERRRKALETASDSLKRIFALIKSRTKRDFSGYKTSTINRRIERRMSLNKIDNLEDYIRLLQENKEEVQALLQDFLIQVTSFFRDPEAFDVMREKVILSLLRRRNGEGTIRVWVPGCSSGEEAYSIAILFRECMEKEPALTVRIQIYGTDIDQDAIGTARQGIYPANIATDVSADRLRQYFIREDSQYRIRKEIRDMVVFAPQNAIADPPFTKLDLLCCRNLLIYLTPEIQKRLLPLFHYSLNQHGFLFLGSAETISGYADLFSPVDQKWKIFERRESLAAIAALPGFPARPLPPEYDRVRAAEKAAAGTETSFQETIHRMIVETVTPPVLIVTRKGELLYSTRKTGKYFEPVVGTASLNVFDMAREGLRVELAIAVRQAIARDHEVVVPNLAVRTNGDVRQVRLVVRPIAGTEVLRDLVMIVLEELPETEKTGGRGKRKKNEIAISESAAIGELEKELQYTKEHLQTTVEEMETSQEELKSANEELQSTNEELQSTNEELTTSKEELQSLNEELMTVNAELQGKNDELALTNNDMRNLLNSTQIPTVFLDNNLGIKRYTTPATNIFTLIPGDVGRPLSDIKSHLQYTGLADDIHAVLDTLVFREIQVQADTGKWYIMRIMPYRTMENLIDGVVITFSDISDLKALTQVLKDHEKLSILAGIVLESDDAIIVEDLNGTILAWNRGASRLYGWDEEDVLGKNGRDYVPGDARDAYDAVAERIRNGEHVRSFRTTRLVKGGGTIEVNCLIRELAGGSGVTVSIATTETPVAGSPAAKKRKEY